ncbi:colicin V production protein [Herbihabitans rhizosphaerae]|uniref:Colicin V production protein n=1 Tax=Herbihabitans rhizosphaerae TaxID=1872711 RepID=A0A4Q7KZW6_9PSEU|nr:MarP family serine protease [Herbihabitans rhizosphaerae]RZS41282.1 colicin V production protein [Herbihabitans rhizosphaerae]
MNWVDLLVILLAVVAMVSGARQGVIIALPAFVGVLIGAIIGIKVAPLVVEHIETTPTRVAIAVAVFVLLVALGETFGVWGGRLLREKINSPKLAGVDSTLGAVVQGAVVFVVAWLIGAALTSVGNLPGLSSAINRSVVLGGVNDVMPEAAHALPAELRKLLDESGFHGAVSPFSRAPNREVAAPDPALQGSFVVSKLEDSVLKINAKAPSCSRAMEGTGFVIAPQRIMTNAHVVAGADEVSVQTKQGALPARVVHYDPGTDIAVLSVPRLRAEKIPFAERDAVSGDSAIVLGYPLDGPYHASSARVRERTNLRGPDIYDSRTVTRDVFTIRGDVRSGNSGGPLVDEAGQVIGVVFGAAVGGGDTGFVLTADEVADEVANAPRQDTKVATGQCAR